MYLVNCTLIVLGNGHFGSTVKGILHCKPLEWLTHGFRLTQLHPPNQFPKQYTQPGKQPPIKWSSPYANNFQVFSYQQPPSILFGRPPFQVISPQPLTIIKYLSKLTSYKLQVFGYLPSKYLAMLIISKYLILLTCQYPDPSLAIPQVISHANNPQVFNPSNKLVAGSLPSNPPSNQPC